MSELKPAFWPLSVLLDAWFTLPTGIYVPREHWDRRNDAEFEWLRTHEATHLQRMNSRPFFSRWWWAVHYLISWRMRLDEEVTAIRAELAYLPPLARRQKAWEEAVNLVDGYRIPLTYEEVFQRVYP